MGAWWLECVALVSVAALCSTAGSLFRSLLSCVRLTRLRFDRCWLLCSANASLVSIAAVLRWFALLSCPRRTGPEDPGEGPLDSRAFRLSDCDGCWGTGNLTPVSLGCSASVGRPLCCFRLRWLWAGPEVLLGADLLAIRSISELDGRVVA